MGVCEQLRRITFTSRADDHGNGFLGHSTNRGDDLVHRITVPQANVEEFRRTRSHAIQR